MSAPFANTRAALVVFDQGGPERRAAWSCVDTVAGCDAAEAAGRAALELVQRAFHRDTSHINSWAQCSLADIEFMRSCAAIPSSSPTTEESP